VGALCIFCALAVHSENRCYGSENGRAADLSDRGCSFIHVRRSVKYFYVLGKRIYCVYQETILAFVVKFQSYLGPWLYFPERLLARGWRRVVDLVVQQRKVHYSTWASVELSW
jgi:hypothetical protein